MSAIAELIREIVTHELDQRRGTGGEGCLAELETNSGHVLHCTARGVHTTHRFSVEA